MQSFLLPDTRIEIAALRDEVEARIVDLEALRDEADTKHRKLHMVMGVVIVTEVVLAIWMLLK